MNRPQNTFHAMFPHDHRGGGRINKCCDLAAYQSAFEQAGMECPVPIREWKTEITINGVKATLNPGFLNKASKAAKDFVAATVEVTA